MKQLKKWLFPLALRLVANQLSWGEKLTPEYLKAKGWVMENGHYIESGTKDRDSVKIHFPERIGGASYIVRHGPDNTYIAHETAVEWLEAYLLLVHAEKRQQL